MATIKDHIGKHWRTYLEIYLAGVVVLGVTQQFFDIQLPAPWRSDPKTRIAVSMPESGQIGRCATIRGTGHAPKGESIWLVQQTMGHGSYYLKPAREEMGGEGRWSVYGQVGDDKGGGLQYAFQAILIDDDWGRWLPAIVTSNGLSTSEIPPHQAASPKVVVTRNADNRPCG
ncbi:hypothetical protein [Actinomadura monticuli]|uniref:Uncharacterized protein n=1 Tax=Actinomadura monticuli TaxID=3097367 RepID=A0ABV4Q4Q6_9ACTN